MPMWTGDVTGGHAHSPLHVPQDEDLTSGQGVTLNGLGSILLFGIKLGHKTIKKGPGAPPGGGLRFVQGPTSDSLFQRDPPNHFHRH